MDWKYLLGGAAVVGAGAILIHKMNRLSKELETVTRVNIFKVTLTGLQLQIDVTLKNPTGTGLKLKYPFVKLQFKDTDSNGKEVMKTLAMSQVKNETISIPKFGEIQLPSIMVNLDFITLGMNAPAALSQWRSEGTIELAVKTITTIEPNIPYTKTDNMKIGNRQET